MKVAIVNPPRVDGFAVVREERYEHKDVGALYPPLSLLYTASVTERAGHEVLMIEANGFDISQAGVESRLAAFHPDVVVSRFAFDCQEEDLRTLAFAKQELKAVTVVRNSIIADVDWLKQEFLGAYPFVDVFLNCEPEAVVPGLLEHLGRSGLSDLERQGGISFLSGGRLVTTGEIPVETDLDRYPFPAYHLLPSLKPYHTGVLEQPTALVSTTRGCPFSCTFCAYRKTGYRMRSPENVVEELKLLKATHGIRSFVFFDDVIGLQKGRFERICELLIEAKLGLKWVACSRANLVNLDLLRLMKKSGCQELAFGIESGDEAVLEATTKKITLDEIREAARQCRKAGVLFYGMAIIGLPGETRQSIRNTVRFIKSIRPFYTQFCFSTPFPNTEVYRYYEENGLLLTKDWRRYSPLSPEPVVRTRDLSKEDLVEMRNWVYRAIILDPVYLLSKIRLFDWKWNISGFVKIMQRIAAIIFRRYIR